MYDMLKVLTLLKPPERQMCDGRSLCFARVLYFSQLEKETVAQPAQQRRGKSVSEVWSYVELEKFIQTLRTPPGPYILQRVNKCAIGLDFPPQIRNHLQCALVSKRSKMSKIYNFPEALMIVFRFDSGTWPT